MECRCGPLFRQFCKAGMLLGGWVDRSELRRLAERLRTLDPLRNGLNGGPAGRPLIGVEVVEAEAARPSGR
jgi:hypothetical protein